MTLVRIVKNWAEPDLLRQTPGGSGAWGGVQFTLDPVDECDYLVVLNRVTAPVQVRCNPYNVWAVMQEPPNEIFRSMHRGAAGIARVYTQDPGLRGRRYLQSQPGLPWHVARNYDELVALPVPQKQHALSWITSNLAVFAGHRSRLEFLDRLRSSVPFDLYGRGFNPIADKWDGLAPYRYSIVVENFQNPYYWSEKIADPLLAWTMPIYFGCTRMGEYLPKGSFVAIDINDPTAVEQVQAIIASDLWERNIDAIAEARRRILNTHQLFPLLVGEIQRHASHRTSNAAPQHVTVTDQLLSIDQLRERVRSAYSRHFEPHVSRVQSTIMKRVVW
jgi:Glycosyltransferase family 10 (fucosyltransferase) C-term